MEFYSRLGFRIAPDTGSGEVGHVVVSDGRISIGLWAQGIDRPTLVFVRSNLDRYVSLIRSLGVTIDAVTIGEESFNSLDGRMPNGVGIRLVEAITHSPQPEGPSRLGWFTEVGFHRSAGRAEVWQELGLVALDLSDETPPKVAVISDSLNLSFYPDTEFGDFWLCFECHDLRSTATDLTHVGVEYSYTESSLGLGSLLVTAPEGTRLVLCQSA